VALRAIRTPNGASVMREPTNRKACWLDVVHDGLSKKNLVLLPEFWEKELLWDKDFTQKQIQIK
jgi:hypothetical protein